MIYTGMGSECEIAGAHTNGYEVHIVRKSDGKRILYPLYQLKADGGRNEIDNALAAVNRAARLEARPTTQKEEA